MRVLVDWLDRRSRAKGLDAALQFHLALVANSGLTEKSFDAAQEAAKEGYYDLVGAFRPWEGRSYLHRRQSEFKDSRQAYIDAFGVDPLDPAFKAWEAEQIRKLNSGEFAGPVDEAAAAEAELTRRLRERGRRHR